MPGGVRARPPVYQGQDATSHPHLRTKLEAVGYGFLVPVFFVASGVRLDLQGLVSSPSALARVPVFLLALLLVRGLAAAPYLSTSGALKPGRDLPTGESESDGDVHALLTEPDSGGLADTGAAASATATLPCNPRFVPAEARIFHEFLRNASQPRGTRLA